MLANPEIRERFRREAKALASVLHQNIAHVYDFSESEEEALIFMEYIDGIDLSQIIQKVGALPAEVAAAILLGLARGVSYIHNRHLIHRDIKPSNIRLTARGEVKLMDFGIVMDTESHSLTRPGMMVGSPSYLSPEQVIGDPLTPQSDIFLLGICLYEMLTGTRPFKEEGNKTVFQRIRECEYISAQEMNSAIPRKLNRIIEKCLEKDPRDRYATAKEVVQELETFLGFIKSNHTQDLILGFFDEESLLVPAMSYSDEIKAAGSWKQTFSSKTWLLILLLASLSLAIGYVWGRNDSVHALPYSAKPLK
ncbi:MAG: serine/threonine protein kinase [Proteobacteria bacterium]|nr:serine/threonine protein kinase [Pseudomonadota bacterium]